MHRDDPFVIVGAGLAGATAARTLREEGFTGRVVLIGDETDPPYERPPLSKDYLMGRTDRDATFMHPRHWYADNGIDLRTGVAVTRIDPGWHEVTLADGSHLGYSKLLLTPGRPRGNSGSPAPSWAVALTCGGSATATGSRKCSAPHPAL
jgi:3-phenylpropionate/trans-cinnamate dioxygenase ferredoxin reductase subunit